MKRLFIPLLLLIILIIFLSMARHNQINCENFKNKDDTYLYPIKGLEPICSEENLFPSYMPKSCYVDNVLDSYANCKCEDINGNCRICYPTIVKDSKNSSVVYNADVGF